MSRTEARIVEELRFLNHQQDMFNSIPCPIEDYYEQIEKISERKAELWKELKELSNEPIVQDAKTSLCVINGIA